MKKPDLGPLDVHIVVNCATNLAKCYVPGEALPRWIAETHTEGLSRNTEAWGGDTPSALWEATAVEHIPPSDPESASYGVGFITLVCHEAIKRAAVGIGWHGGGTGLPDPLAPRQGWAHTLGCLRSQNIDLVEKVFRTIEFVLKRGGRVWLSVVR